MLSQNRLRWLSLAALTATVGRSVFLRRVSLAGARLSRSITAWATTSWRPLVLVYLLAAFLLGAKHFLTADDPTGAWFAFWSPPKKVSLLHAVRWFLSGDTGPWLQALGLAAVLYAVRGAWRARERIRISAFANATGDPAQAAFADGLSRRVMTELGEITDIYQDVSDDPADLSTDAAMKLEVADEAASAFANLKASMKDQKVEVWGLKIPLDWAANTLAALVRGPQITGSVQKTSQGYMLEASLAGGGYDQTWRVGPEDIAEQIADTVRSDGAVADAMTRQLAFRIFTQLAGTKVGTPSWRATFYYTEALRAFRESKRDRSKAPALLQEAQRDFFQAYRHDSRFAQSRYNLGVILYTQGEYQAAYQVFKRVINDSAGASRSAVADGKSARRRMDFLSQVHYAAAKASQNLGQHPAFAGRSKYHCENALELNPWNSRAWNLRSVLRYDESQAPEHGTKPFDTLTILYVRRAATLSWRGLCATASRGEAIKLAAALTLTHLTNLALALEGRRSSARVMRQALRLEPLNAGNWCTLGQLYLKIGKPRPALRAFQDANRVQEKPLHWLWLACTYRLPPNHKNTAELATDAWERATADRSTELFENAGVTTFWNDWRLAMEKGKLQSPVLEPWPSEAAGMIELLKGLRQKLEQVQKNPDLRSRTIDEWNAQLASTAQPATQGAASPAAAGQTSSGSNAEEDPWFHAQILRCLGLLYEWDGKPREAQSCYEKAAVTLERDHASEIARRGLRFQVARMALAALEDAPDAPEQVGSASRDYALQLVTDALQRNPNDGRERSLLVNSYLVLGLPKLATDELENALSLAPESDDIRGLGINVFWRIYATITDLDLRRAALQRMALLFRDLAAQRNVLNIERGTLGWGSFWQAACQAQLLDFTSAQAGLETAYGCRYKPVHSLSYLCTVYRQSNAFEEAERTYKRLISLLQELGRREPLAKADSPLLLLTPELRSLGEEKPPALWFAWAAIDSAVGMAELGLASAVARARFVVGWQWRRQLKQAFHSATQSGADKQGVNADDLRDLDGGMFRTLGVILLAHARAKDPASTPIPCLKRALKCFTRSLALTPDAGLRSFLFYRKALAFVELAKSDSENASHWQSCAAESLSWADIADRFGEYQSRIKTLGAALGISEDKSPADSGAKPKKPPSQTPPPSNPAPSIAPTPSTDAPGKDPKAEEKPDPDDSDKDE